MIIIIINQKREVYNQITSIGAVASGSVMVVVNVTATSSGVVNALGKVITGTSLTPVIVIVTVVFWRKCTPFFQYAPRSSTSINKRSVPA